jgi:hypothetical protein
MRVLLALGLLVAAAFLTLLLLVDLAQELSRQPYQVPPDLDESDDWEGTAKEVAGAAPSPGNQYRVPRTVGERVPGSSNALDDLRSAL